MFLNKTSAATPLCLFAVVVAAFVLNQRYGIDIYRQYYPLCHFIWGLGGPLLFGYFHLDLRQIRKGTFLEIGEILRANPIRAWPWALSTPRRNQYNGAVWSPWAGALWVLAISIRNEVFVDPVQNAVPFVQAYQHFATDVLGIGVFLMVCWSLRISKACGQKVI